jgi:hypothetical protein
MAGRGRVEPRRPAPRRCKNASICARPHLEDRAGGVQQPPAGRQQRPQRVQQLGLDARQRRHVVGRRSQRMSGWRRTMPEALHGASSRMASKGRPSHQRAGRRASPAFSSACSRSRQRVLHARQALRVAVQRQQVQVGQLQQVRGLAAGAAQASSTRARRQAGRPSSSGAARCAAASCTETRLRQSPAAAHRAGRGQHHGLAAQAGSSAAWRPPLRGQALHVGRAAAAAGVDAQRHRRVRLAASSACQCAGQSLLAAARSTTAGGSRPHRRVQRRRHQASRSRRKRRSTALTKPAAAGVRWRAAATAWSTSVCSA